METLQKSYLFWDVDQKKLDQQKHKNFIIERILAFGDKDDLRWASNFYGEKSIRGVFLEKNEKLDDKSRNFFCLYFNINPLECTKKLSMKRQGAFFKR